VSFLSSTLASAFSRPVVTAPPPFEATAKVWPKIVETYVASLESHTNEDLILRASGLGKLCPRQFVLNYWRPLPRESVGLKSSLFMDMGTMLHAYLQNFLLGPAGILFGDWRNVKTGETITNSYSPGEHVSLRDFRKEGALEWEYVERTLYHPGWRIGGHNDGVVHVERMAQFCELVAKGLPATDVVEEIRKSSSEGTKAVLEIKTTGTRIFESLLSSADLSHDYQTQATAYQTLLSMSSTFFWFFNRDTFATKSLIYYRDPLKWDDVRKKAQLVWESIRDETLPDTFMPCASVVSTRAKTCPHASACWSALPFSEYVARAKASQPYRNWLDLSSWQPPEQMFSPLAAVEL
jgi:hypothetical protein